MVDSQLLVFAMDLQRQTACPRLLKTEELGIRDRKQFLEQGVGKLEGLRQCLTVL